MFVSTLPSEDSPLLITSNKYDKVYEICTGAIFLIVSAALLIPTFYLIKELSKEEFKFMWTEFIYLIVLFLVFTVCYFGRSIVALSYAEINF